MILRIVFHAIDQIGLGHLSRSIAIALRVRERAPESSILFVVDGVDHGLLAASGIPFVAVPAFRDPAPSNRWPRPRRNDLAASLSDAIVCSMRPHLIVFDCFPSPHLVSSARGNGVPFAVCVRAMKDNSGYLDWLAGNFSDAARILVAHDAGEL